MNATIRIMAAVLIAAMVTNFAEAKVWRMNNNAGIKADFSSFAQAFATVSNNDTIYLEGSLVSYGTVDLKMPLTIIGPGYFLSQNPNTQANPVSATVTGFTFDTGSDSSSMIGVYSSNDSPIYINVSNITLRKCCVSSISFNVNGALSNILISQCYVYENDIRTYTLSGTVNNLIISNNYIQGQIYFPSGFSGTISNNIIYSNGMNVANFTIFNNIIYGGSATLNNCIYYNNIGSGTQFPNNADNINNLQNVTMSTVFAGTGSTDGQWQLASGSPASGAGFGLVDCGMFGGTNPYVLSGMPEIPSIYELNMPYTGYSNGGINVTVKATVH